MKGSTLIVIFLLAYGVVALIGVFGLERREREQCRDMMAVATTPADSLRLLTAQPQCARWLNPRGRAA